MEQSFIFKLHEDLPRQGPGSDACTETAFNMIPGLPKDAKILDIGCGSGMQTLALARLCPRCSLVAVDVHQPYLDDLIRRAASAGCADRISTLCASMDDLPFKEGQFDLIWAEGSIFVIGFEQGLSYWKRFLKKGGYIALTEAAWFTDTPSEEARAFWQECYPAIKAVAELEAAVICAGFQVIGRFALPASAWWDDYYRPLERKLDALEVRKKDDADAMSLIEMTRTEMAIHRDHHEEYGYVFFVGYYP